MAPYYAPAKRSNGQFTTGEYLPIEHGGVTGTITEWASILGTTVDLLQSRIHQAGSFEQAVAWYGRVGNEHAQSTVIEFEGLKLTLNAWAQLTGIKKADLQTRLQRGWEHPRVLTQPTKAQKLAGIESHLPTIRAFKEEQQ